MTPAQLGRYRDMRAGGERAIVAYHRATREPASAPHVPSWRPYRAPVDDFGGMSRSW